MIKRSDVQTIKLISSIVEKQRRKTIRKLMKRLKTWSLNDLQFLARMLGIK